MELNYIQFTKEMKKDYTILAPNMLPMHLKMILKIMQTYGYNVELLETTGPEIAELGLHYVHNDTCYPAILVIGQFLQAIESGKYDPHKVALMLTQTGGGCRASNYISLLRKALAKAGYPYVPVIAMGVAGIEKHPGFQLSVPMLHAMLFAVLYGDLLMDLVNQTRPYELNPGQAERLAHSWTERLSAEMGNGGKRSYWTVKRHYREILEEFAAIPKKKEPKVLVGVVGEIFVKYSPLGNNNLEAFLLKEGAEVVVPGLMGFIFYCVYNTLVDHRKYGRSKAIYPIFRMAYSFFLKKQRDLIAAYRENGQFREPTEFTHTVSLVEGYIDYGVKMGEGWLLPAEMLELVDEGVKNIVCTQPFGCLPNHICGKGMMKPIKERNPDVNIVAIDYDAGATQVNQENRIKLMLSNAWRNLEADMPAPQKEQDSAQTTENLAPCLV